MSDMGRENDGPVRHEEAPIDPGRLEIFIESMTEDIPSDLKELKDQCMEDNLPVIRQPAERLLRLLLTMKRPEKVLEIGAAAGYSAIFMMSLLNTDARLDTIESFYERAERARDNFSKFGFSDRINLFEGDAGQILPKLNDQYDFIFLDAAKGQYISWLPEIIRLMAPGAVLVSDNVLQDGSILMSHFVIPRRMRTINKRMRQYLKAVSKDERLVTDILNAGDGMTVSVRKYDE